MGLKRSPTDKQLQRMMRPATAELVTSALAHGGELSDAAAFGHGPILDLSTGINPHAYPAAWDMRSLAALPQRSAMDALLRAARSAYRVPDTAHIVAAPGTQAILQWLPHIVPATEVAVIGPTYQEHAARWQRSSVVHERAEFDPHAAALVVVVNPNNPDGRLYPKEVLAEWANTLAAGRGRALAEAGHPVLIVDEAFMDLSPGETVAGMPHTLVLRSFGKFYGLAGLRLGFAIGSAATVARITDALGPWAVSAPALSIGRSALADEAWASAMRKQLAEERAHLDDCLSAAGLAVRGGTDLFRLVETENAGAWQRAMAEEGVWTRSFSYAPTWLRIGLPGPAEGVFRAALERARRSVRLLP